LRGRWRFAAWALAVPALGLAAALTTATPGSTTSGYGPGTFAFAQTSDRGFSFHIYVSDTAGAGRRLVTTRRAVGRPAMSPDGRQVAFSGPLTDDSDGRYGIYVVNIDGTGLRLLTAPRFADFDPAWSPDGRVIAFTHNSNGNGRLSCCAIGLMYADGSSQHLVPGTTYGMQPTWSPDSARLAYAAYDGLHAVNTNGSAPAVLVRGVVEWPAWSPDGQRIAYVRTTSASYSQVQVVPASGGTPAAVESLPARAESPAWGLDGTTLYYVLFHGYGDEGRTDSAVWRSTTGGPPGRLFGYGTGLTANVYGLAYFGSPLQLPTKPSAVSWGNGRLDVFVRGTNSALYHKYYAGGAWSGWESLGGALTGNPEVVSWGNGRLDVFVRGTDSTLHHKYYAGGAWSGWESLGGALTGNPEVVSWGNGRLDVFVRGTNSALFHKYYAVGWSGWESLGGILTGNPEVVSWGNGRLDVFVRGTNSALFHKYYAVGWSSWEILGGILTSDPAAASRGTSTLDVAVRGAGGSLYVDSYSGGWRGFRGFGGSLGGAPDATSSAAGSVDVTASGSPPYPPLLHSRGNAAGWTPVDQQAGPLGGIPASVSWGTGRLDVFYRSTDGSLRHRSYDGGIWSSEQNLGGELAAY